MSIDQSQLPPADITLHIAGLGPCTDNPDRTLHLNAKEPVTVLVHGCFGSSGQFRGLAQVLAFHGQQTACFTYSDRAGLKESAAALASSSNQLAEKLTGQVTIIGHSQGALIARKALTDDKSFQTTGIEAKMRLVTVSGPFSGIASAQACGSPLMKVLSLGMVPLSCKIFTGDKWADITYSSEFIRNPGVLRKEVQSYLKIDTDERNTCRSRENGKCVEDDFIFTLEEQRNAFIANNPNTNIVEIKAGHVEIVGNKHVAPVKLISVLQENGIIRLTEPKRVDAFNRLLAKIYRDNSLWEFANGVQQN